MQSTSLRIFFKVEQCTACIQYTQSKSSAIAVFNEQSSTEASVQQRLNRRIIEQRNSPVVAATRQHHHHHHTTINSSSSSSSIRRLLQCKKIYVVDERHALQYSRMTKETISRPLESSSWSSIHSRLLFTVV
jgi:hypothetical protein